LRGHIPGGCNLTLLTKAGIVLNWQTTLWAVLVLFFGQVVARENVQWQMGAIPLPFSGS